MGRPPKTLAELIRDNAFRVDRHAALIAAEPLPEEPPEWAAHDRKAWGGLVKAQRRVIDPDPLVRLPYWTDEDEEGQRRAIRREYTRLFSRAVRALHGSRLPWELGGPAYVTRDGREFATYPERRPSRDA